MESLTLNLHLTEKCNFSCVYCFAHWDKKEEIFSNAGRFVEFIKFLDQQARFGMGVQNLTINFAGGEPARFKHLTAGVDACRSLNIKTSVISNGLLFRRYGVEQIANMFDVVGISVDSVQSSTNESCGRVDRSGRAMDYDLVKQNFIALKKLRPNLITKINTVVSNLNYCEEIISYVNSCGIDRWKIFRVLPVGNIAGISAENFSYFLSRNAGYAGTIIEDNADMLEAYIMINSNGNLYQSSEADGRIAYKYYDLMRGGLFEGLRRIGFNVGKYRRRYRVDGGFCCFEEDRAGRLADRPEEAKRRRLLS